MFREYGTENEVIGDGRKLHNAGLHDPYSSSNIIRVIKSRRMRWAGRVARMEERKGSYGVFVGKPDWIRQLGRRW
jgi:hypothetical protein